MEKRPRCRFCRVTYHIVVMPIAGFVVASTLLYLIIITEGVIIINNKIGWQKKVML